MSIVKRDNALKILANNLPLFYDTVHLYLNDGKSIHSNESKIVWGIEPDTEDEKERVAVMGAMLSTLAIALGQEDHSVEISIDDVIYLTECMTYAWGSKQLAELGLCEFDEKKS